MKKWKDPNLTMSFFVHLHLASKTTQLQSKTASPTCGRVPRETVSLCLRQVVECRSICKRIIGTMLCILARYSRRISSYSFDSFGPGEDRQVVNEGSPVADPTKNPRSARLIYAEETVLKNGGACLRMAGLYNLDRGAHNFWMTSGKDVSGRADGIINQVHYDDAAGSVAAAIAVGPTVVNGNIFLISDSHPMTRKEICESTLKAKKYQGKAMPKFLGTDSDPVGKIYVGSASNKALKWDARYESFDSFMASQA